MELRPVDIPSVMRLLGTRYLKDGRTSDGLDCYGFLVVAFSEIGEEISDNPMKLLTYRNQWKLVKHPLRPWDVLFFPKFYTDLVTHVTLVVDDRDMMHADRLMGSVVRQPIAKFAHKIKAIARMKRFQ